jgi:signal peptidase II
MNRDNGAITTLSVSEDSSARSVLRERCCGALLVFRVLVSVIMPHDSQRVGLGFVLTLALSIFFLDQLAKYAVVSTIPLGNAITVVPGILGFTHANNPGAATGILGQSATILLLACIVSLAALMWLSRSFPASFYLRVGSGLLFGGAASNLVDRLFVGAVVDYVQLVRWVFNGADVAVAVGAVALTFSVLRSARSR